MEIIRNPLSALEINGPHPTRTELEPNCGCETYCYTLCPTFCPTYISGCPGGDIQPGPGYMCPE